MAIARLTTTEEATRPPGGRLPNIGVVVVHWRGMEDTRECLASLASVAYPEVDVVVVVNGREDFDDELARSSCPHVRVVRAGSNGGYAAGCNLGVRALLADAEI